LQVALKNVGRCLQVIYASIEEAWHSTCAAILSAVTKCILYGAAKAAGALDPVDRIRRYDHPLRTLPQDYEPGRLLCDRATATVDGLNTCMYDVMLYAISGSYWC
jgi:hypothetical protein